MATLTGETELTVGPRAWELKRNSEQESGGITYVHEVYEGCVMDVESRNDQLLYTLRTNNVIYKAEGSGYTLTVQVTYDAEAEAVATNKYAVNDTIGECKAGEEVMVWHLSLD